MTTYGFQDRPIAEKLARFARQNLKPAHGEVQLTRAKGSQFVCRTPAGGIPARTDTPDIVAGKADCEVFTVLPDGSMVPQVDGVGKPLVLEVFNIFSAEVAENVWITAKVVGTMAVVDAEDCG